MIILCQDLLEKSDIMKLSEYMSITGVTKKTAYWVYSQNHNDTNRDLKHRQFNEKDVDYVLCRKMEKYPYRLKQIKDFPKYYISEMGHVFINDRNFLEEIQPYITNGYRYVTLHNGEENKHFKISKLVAIYFVPNPMNKPVPNHKDGNKQNDIYTNLEWTTISENTKHAFDMGLAKNDKGEEDSQSKPVDMFRNDGKFIKHFGSISLAAKEMNIPKRTISNQCSRYSKGKRGYYFRFSNK